MADDASKAKADSSKAEGSALEEEEAESELAEEGSAEEVQKVRSSAPQFDRTATLDTYTYEALEPLTWLPEVPEAGSAVAVVEIPQAPPASISMPEPPPLRPQVVHRTFNVESGCMRLEWVVSARKLVSSDTHPAVSPAFDLSFGEAYPNVPFKLLIHPKVVDDRKGGASFKMAGGRGYVELACEEVLPASAPEVTFRIAIGTGEKRHPHRGPVSHNFSQKKVCGLPKDQALWNFNTAVDKETKTFAVCLEILPQGTEVAAAVVGSSALRKEGPKRW